MSQQTWLNLGDVLISPWGRSATVVNIWTKSAGSSSLLYATLKYSVAGPEGFSGSKGNISSGALDSKAKYVCLNVCMDGLSDWKFHKKAFDKSFKPTVVNLKDIKSNDLVLFNGHIYTETKLEAIIRLSDELESILGRNEKFIVLNRKDTTLYEDDIMSQKPLLTMLKDNAQEAAYHVAADKATAGLKEGMLMVMKKKGMGEDKESLIRDLLSSDVGTAALAVLMGIGLNYMPIPDPRLQKLANVLQVRGIATAGNQVLDGLWEYMIPAVTQALSALPAIGADSESKVRVDQEMQANAPAEEMMQEDETPMRALA